MSALLLSWLVSGGAITIVLVLHGYLVACEISLVKLRYSSGNEAELAELKEKPGIARIIDQSDRFGRQVRFSKNLCTVSLGLLLLPFLRDSFLLLNGEDVSQHKWVLFLLALAIAVFAHFLFAEVIPRGLALRSPAAALRRSYPVLIFFQIVTWPLLFCFRRIKRPVYRWLGTDVDDELNPLDVDVQIRAMGEDSTTMTPVVRKIVNRALGLSDLVVQDILLPRSQVVSCNLEDPLEDNLQRMRDAGHTRFPLCRGDIDHCIGIIHIKDIFRYRGPSEQLNLLKLRRNIIVFTAETKVEEALERMLVGKFHMGIVVDEFGGTIGLLTLEGILEELVGEIQDEFDFEEADIELIDANERCYRISGLCPVHDVEEELVVEIENDEVSTFGGLITAELGRIPEKGETLEAHGLKIEVAQVDERRVISAKVWILSPGEDKDTKETETNKTETEQ